MELHETNVIVYDIYETDAARDGHDYVCGGCGLKDTDRMLLIDSETGSVLLCYTGCAQDFQRQVSELKMPAEDHE